jgi:hypothetical protein
MGVRGSVGDWSVMLQASKVADFIPDAVTGVYNWLTPSSRTIALGSTQPLIETSTKNLPGVKRRPGHKAGNLTAICEPIV